MNLKSVALSFALSLMCLMLPAAAFSEVLEVEVNGMTCAFCVESLQRSLGKLPNVDKVDVSLKNKKVRIDTGKAPADLAAIRQTIIDSGFTPLKVNES